MESNLTNISLPLTLGLDPITNEPISIDLGKCGNILLAGSTKQGKSHCIHNLISQLDTMSSPPKMILFDPKRCEFSNYKDEHHVIETLSDAKTTLFTELFEREIIKRSVRNGQDQSPFVIIIDELLDLILMHKSGSPKHFDDRIRYEAIIKILANGPEHNIYTIISTQSTDRILCE